MFWSTSTVTIHSPPVSTLVTLRDTNDEISLREFIESKCPSIFKPFRPTWWLFNGHLQTIYCAVGNFSHVGQVRYERRYLSLLDGGTLGLDFTGPHQQDEIRKDTPIVVVMHGLTGGSYEPYVRTILSITCASVENGGFGYRGVVVNFRGCKMFAYQVGTNAGITSVIGADVPATSPQLYSAGHTDDLRTALLYLSLCYPNAKLIGLAFSLGANVMTRYLGEEGQNSKLASGCVLACGSYFNRNVYSKTMGQSFRRILLKNSPGMGNLYDRLPEHEMQWVLQHERFTITELDEHVIRFIGGSSPPFPFPSAWAYKRWASSHEHVKSICVPFIAFNALDDPVVSNVPVPLPEEAKHTLIVTTDSGGHLGWFQRPARPDSLWHMEQWTCHPVCEWIKATAEDLVDPRPLRTQDTELVGGFVTSKDNPNIGYKGGISTSQITTSNEGMVGLVTSL
ncbi:hypothetical protein Clacol_003633 [Clathrus columnatus]|uniref:AB-hydrolase YheT n=1 Tax=Clathrus columnatus TaxID=1419009 RepID=A0AAV5AA59_9AGAM|nr:hypothetical protein Clacol_003633 [Clathrus columnatus]